MMASMPSESFRDFKPFQDAEDGAKDLIADDQFFKAGNQAEFQGTGAT